MTREEAINTLHELWRETHDPWYEEVYNMAIEALSAEAVKVAYICDGRKCDSDCSECFSTTDIEHAKDFKLMGKTYYQLPSAEAVQGEWIDIDDEPYCKCSKCGTYIDSLDDYYSFCPYCGADMRGGDDK